jgi:shikimate kinase
MSINSYFAEHGEDAFRQEESRVLKSIDYPQNCVVATGGGAPCYFDNLQWMNKKGLTVYIDMSPLELASRLDKGKAKRPLLKDLSEAEIVDFIQLKLSDRAKYYKRAFITIKGKDLTIDRLRNRLYQFF